MTVNVRTEAAPLLLSVEAAHNLGAQAMQSQIAAFLMVKGEFVLAPQVLGMSPPRFQLPERVTLERLA